MDTLQAAPFKKGDKAHIISPSAGLMPFVKQRVQRAKANLEKLGYQVVIGKSAASNLGYVSAKIDERIEDIHTAFKDKSCSLILCSIGGNHSNQLLSNLNYKLIKDNPKAFCGYSDITVLHLAFLAKTGLQTFYGPTFLNQFGEYPEVLPYTLDHFKRVVMQRQGTGVLKSGEKYTDEILDWFTNEDAKRPRKLVRNKGLETWKQGKTEGWCLPFTIPSINHILNTPYMPSRKQAVLFIDIPEGGSMHEGLSISDFDSWFSDLGNSGIFKQTAGIVIGRAYKYSEEMVVELQKIVSERTLSYEFPVIYGIDMGHTDPMTTLPYNAKVVIDTYANNLITLE